MAGTQMSSILGTVTCNQTWSAQLRLRILSKGSAMLLHPLSLRLLNSFPFMTMMWLSSPLPSSSCSLWSTVHYHHQRYTMFLHTLVRDFYPAHVLKHHMPCEPKVTWKVCLGHSRFTPVMGKETSAHSSGIWGWNFLRCGQLNQREGLFNSVFLLFGGSTPSNT